MVLIPLPISGTVSICRIWYRILSYFVVDLIRIRKGIHP